MAVAWLWLSRKEVVSMQINRSVFALRFLVAAIGTLVMIVTLIEVRARLPVAREQRAIGYLVKAGASVQLFHECNGIRYYTINLAGCDRCEDNDELLRYVPDIENVTALSLAPLPLHEAGRKCLFRLGNLKMLGFYITEGGISPAIFAELKREMKAYNPDMVITACGADGNPVE
jgi:hypothetical protein